MCTEYITTYKCHHHEVTSRHLCRKVRSGECASTEGIYRKVKGICGGCREKMEGENGRDGKDEGDDR